ncbi:hypothetical protein [Halalkalibacter okhensis]|uniref:hypothetical protein n=1 Tax=Halalkalibacter okhensis TaxID=333138 RepID=UPI00068A9C2C|nr:hypothetical protein [Halalkalibacter okhensis]
MKYLLIFVAAILLASCVETEREVQEPVQEEPTEPIESSEDRSQAEDDESPEEEVSSTNELGLEETADHIVTLLRDQDMEALAGFVHPTKGVRFSPYGHIKVDEDKVLTTEQLDEFWTDETVYHWGYFDGSGEPIEKTFRDYYNRFVYDHDYANAEETAVNERLGDGMMIDNSDEIYPDADVVDYYFSGFEEEYDGMDWRSLRIVLEEQDEKWYLVGIIHDEWTI